MNKPFAKWTPIDACFIDCEDLRRAQFAQSEGTKSGVVPAFQVPDCSQTDYPCEPVTDYAARRGE